ncbi:MAG TPA: DUF4276 family protein [Candidatus Ozemobacteraceae bacterium]|nr:DUF4276 family protein [Candidatus Ozemobacteraceae bacterium]HQG27692.1 DUF4276 family protein [Candidatus Ozemobacteraceae bacterium]
MTPAIQPIVEGHGEIEAVPILLRRILDEAGVRGVDILKPMRQKRSALCSETGLRSVLSLAARRGDCRGILVLFDSDGDCPRSLVTRLNELVSSLGLAHRCEIVIPNPEFEAWFVGGISSLSGYRDLPADLEPPPQPEMGKGKKGYIESLLPPGRAYSERVDQPKFSARFDLGQAWRTCRSFRRLTSAVGKLLRSFGVTSPEWPLKQWESMS